MFLKSNTTLKYPFTKLLKISHAFSDINSPLLNLKVSAKSVSTAGLNPTESFAIVKAKLESDATEYPSIKLNLIEVPELVFVVYIVLVVENNVFDSVSTNGEKLKSKLSEN